MDKKYFDGGAFQVLPLLLATILAAPLGNAMLDRFGYESSVVSQVIAGSIGGACVGVGVWLIMVLIDIVRSPKK